ncbi:hypothetical protein ACM46_11350 [Chryseobacterium angstadtii]|uniref:Uncharacterized protein n=1 Tax=Chryseobacterium angstadtii TaxID=558151 RepID=A0A0J7L6Y0_9FLAO|nr:hypothetical protein [Chryseobacterium angstadtii]KMQ64815.1 hypothetical protein ACM46_11350 [Chryseobacterium angstadtii]
MKEQMMYWQGGNLVLTPNKCYAPRAVRVIIAGLCFWILSVFLAVRFGDFWQLPLAIGSCLSVMALLYKIFSADIRIMIPAGEGKITMSFGGYFKRNFISKNETEIVQNSLNGKPYFAIADKSSPYGKSYQISPFLTHKKRCRIFEEEVLPVIQKQINTKN